MTDIPIHYLKTSIENTNNIPIFKYTNDSIKKTKLQILDELPITKTKYNELKKRLNDYRYVDEIQELHVGTHTRWINLVDLSESLSSKKKTYNLNLNNGAVLTNINIDDNVTLTFKNYMNRFFTINMNENLIFQKLTNQEKIILFTIDNIDKIET